MEALSTLWSPPAWISPSPRAQFMKLVPLSSKKPWQQHESEGLLLSLLVNHTMRPSQFGKSEEECHDHFVQVYNNRMGHRFMSREEELITLICHYHERVGHASTSNRSPWNMQESVKLFHAVCSEIPIPMELLKLHSLEDCNIHYYEVLSCAFIEENKSLEEVISDTVEKFFTESDIDDGSLQ